MTCPEHTAHKCSGWDSNSGLLAQKFMLFLIFEWILVEFQSALDLCWDVSKSNEMVVMARNICLHMLNCHFNWTSSAFIFIFKNHQSIGYKFIHFIIIKQFPLLSEVENLWSHSSEDIVGELMWTEEKSLIWEELTWCLGQALDFADMKTESKRKNSPRLCCEKKIGGSS